MNTCKRLSFISLILFSIIGSVLVSCSKDRNPWGGSSTSSSISKSDVVGSHYYRGYSGPLTRELEITFNRDGSGSCVELIVESYGIVNGVHKNDFKWSISGDKVKLKGVSGRADTDGDSGANSSWSGEFVWQFGMLLPGNPFIEGYAENAVLQMLEYEVSKYVDCKATFDMTSHHVLVTINTRLGAHWKDFIFRYGISLDYANYTWAEDENGKVVFDCGNPVEQFDDIIASVNAKERTEGITQNERNLRDTAQDGIDSYISDFRRGNADIKVDVEVKFTFYGQVLKGLIDVNPSYSVI